MAHGYCDYGTTFKNAIVNRQDWDDGWTSYKQANIYQCLAKSEIRELPPQPQLYTKYELGKNSSQLSLKNSVPLTQIIQFHGTSKWN